jgi:hypothetical protein
MQTTKKVCFKLRLGIDMEIQLLQDQLKMSQEEIQEAFAQYFHALNFIIDERKG